MGEYKKDKSQLDKLKEQFTGGNKKNSPKGAKPKFNFYWIYGIVIVAFIAISMFNFDGTTNEIEYKKFENEMDLKLLKFPT